MNLGTWISVISVVGFLYSYLGALVGSQVFRVVEAEVDEDAAIWVSIPSGVLWPLAIITIVPVWLALKKPVLPKAKVIRGDA